MPRWFWPIWIALSSFVVIFWVIWAIGPARMELAIAPVLTDQSVSDISREAGQVTFGGKTKSIDRLCWRWNRVKQRPASFFSPNIDIFVETAKDASSSTIINRDTGEGWARSAAVGHGLVPEQHWCVMLAPSIRSGEQIRVRQIAYYPGWLGLWTLQVPLPDVVDPPAAPTK